MIKQLRLLFTMLLLTIVGSASADSYVKVTSTDDITNGTYLIVYENGSVAFDGSLTTLDAASNVIDVTINDGVIEATEETDAAAFTINVDDGTLQSASGLYIGATSYANSLKTSEEADAFTNSFAIDSNGDAVITISFETNAVTLRYNKASDQNRFRYYKTGQQAIQLYKKVEGDTPTQVNIATLKSISPTTVTVGDIDEFTLDATFAEGTVADEDYEISWESSDPTILEVDDNVYEAKKAGTVEITVSVTALDDETYKDVSKTFTVTVKEAVSALANIAALTEQTEAGEYAVKLNNAVVTYVNGNYAYIQDESGAVVMYKSGHGLTAGQVLNGTATVTLQIRNSNPQITALSGIEATDGTAPEPTEVAADAWNTPIATVLSQYFKVTGATITKDGTKYYVQLGDETVQLYGQGDARTIQVPDLDITYTIIGFPTLYNTTKELQIFVQPIPEEEVVVVPTPTFNPAAGEVESGTTVEVVCPEEAEGVEYSFDQVSWTEFTDPIEITETTTIFARAYDIDGNTSEVVSAKYTIKEVVPTQDVVIVEEGKTTFLFNTPGNEWGFPTDSKAVDEAEFTANGKTIKIAGTEGNGYRYYGSYLLFGRQGAYLTLPAFDFAVGKIEVVGNSGASGDVKQNIFVGETAISTETKGAKETNTYVIPTLYQEAGTVYTLKVTSAHNSQVTQIIVYEADGTTELADPELAFDVDAVAAILGEEFTAPELTFADGFEGTITYTSSNPDVAEVDNEGNVTLKAAGETTITASSEENDYFFADEASYVLTVSEAVTPVDPSKDLYELVTDASTLADGDEIVIAYVDEENNALAMSSTQNTNNRSAVAVTLNADGTLSPSAETQIITLEFASQAEPLYLFNVGNGYLYASSKSSNQLRTETEADDNAKATIEISEGDATIIFQGENTRNDLRFNPNTSNNNPLFACYGSTSTFAHPRIYRKMTAVPVKIGETGYASLYYEKQNLEITIDSDISAYIVTSTDVTSNFANWAPTYGTFNKKFVIPAGTAVVLNGTPGEYQFNIVGEADVESPAENLLLGTDNETPIEAEDGFTYYILANGGAGVGFYYGAANGGSFTNGAHKAFLAVPSTLAAGAKSFVFNGATGINGVENNVAGNDAVYSLQGVRMNTQNLRRGIYVVNGKKVVIK